MESGDFIGVNSTLIIQHGKQFNKTSSLRITKPDLVNTRLIKVKICFCVRLLVFFVLHASSVDCCLKMLYSNSGSYTSPNSEFIIK